MEGTRRWTYSALRFIFFSLILFLLLSLSQDLTGYTPVYGTLSLKIDEIVDSSQILDEIVDSS